MLRVIALVGLLSAVAAGPARAQKLNARLSFLARQLKKASDPRVRAQNALLLGAAKDQAAVRPLCLAFGDESELVRSSVAKALGQLGGEAAADCLKARKDDDAAVVRAEVARALEALEAAVAAPRPELYIAMSPVEDRSESLEPELLTLAEERLRARLEALGGVFAPEGESRSAARSVLKKKKLKGFMLKVELDSTPSGGLKVNLLCFTYPERTLLGEVNVTASGAKAEKLIRAMAPKVIDEAAETFNWSS